jgi:hypothetical protein
MASDPHVTAEMAALFRRGRDLVAAGGDRRWEEDGGRRREFLELSSLLHYQLGRRTWEEDVFDVADDAGPDAAADVRTAVAARRALLRAIDDEAA